MRVEKIASKAGCEIVASPFLIEEELAVLSQRCSVDWLASISAERLNPAGPKPVSLEILNGGKFYYTKTAWDALHPQRPCGLLQVRAKRGHASGASHYGPAHHDKGLSAGMELYRSEGSDWCVRIWDFPADIGRVLTGPIIVDDTVASGTTIAGMPRSA